MPTPPTPTVRLIAVGSAPGTPAALAKVGDYRLYNYGYRYRIAKILPGKPGGYMHITLEDSLGRMLGSKVKSTTLIVLCDASGTPFTRRQQDANHAVN